MPTHNVPFYTVQEATRESLSHEEMRLFDVVRWVQTICWFIVIASPLVLLGYAFYAMSQPCWKVTVEQLMDLQKQIKEHNEKRAIYTRIVDRINHRIRFDLLAAQILAPTPKGLFLDLVSYKSEPDILSGTVTIQGHTTKPELRPVSNYMNELEKKIRTYLPYFKVNLSLTDHSTDPKSGNLKFTITGKIQ